MGTKYPKLWNMTDLPFYDDLMATKSLSVALLEMSSTNQEGNDISSELLVKKPCFKNFTATLLSKNNSLTSHNRRATNKTKGGASSAP